VHEEHHPLLAGASIRQLVLHIGLAPGRLPSGRCDVADEVIIKSTHRGLRYEDGRLSGVLEAGRYEVSDRRQGRRGGRRPVVEIIVVDMRERELTIKGQEILTADKVAIRVRLFPRRQGPCRSLQR
jgi:hypothetical protein